MVNSLELGSFSRVMGLKKPVHLISTVGVDDNNKMSSMKGAPSPVVDSDVSEDMRYLIGAELLETWRTGNQNTYETNS